MNTKHRGSIYSRFAWLTFLLGFIFLGGMWLWKFFAGGMKIPSISTPTEISASQSADSFVKAYGGNIYLADNEGECYSKLDKDYKLNHFSKVDSDGVPHVVGAPMTKNKSQECKKRDIIDCSKPFAVYNPDYATEKDIFFVLKEKHVVLDRKQQSRRFPGLNLRRCY